MTKQAKPAAPKRGKAETSAYALIVLTVEERKRIDALTKKTWNIKVNAHSLAATCFWLGIEAIEHKGIAAIAALETETK